MNRILDYNSFMNEILKLQLCRGRSVLNLVGTALILDLL